MTRKEMKNKENYLDAVPVKNPEIRYKTDENGIVTLEIKNKGILNRIFQKLLKKPKISYVHLEEFGSFVWINADGEKTIFELGEMVDEKFGKAVHPLYERLSQYFKVLETYNFVECKKKL